MESVNIIGVLENGAQRSPNVPEDVRTKLTIPMQQSVLLCVRVLTADGKPVDLRGNHVVLTVKRSTLDSSRVYHCRERTLSAPSDKNYCELLIAVDRRWPPGKYVWDLWLHTADGRDILVPASPFWLEPSVGGLTPTPA